MDPLDLHTSQRTPIHCCEELGNQVFRDENVVVMWTWHRCGESIQCVDKWHWQHVYGWSCHVQSMVRHVIWITRLCQFKKL